NSDPLERDGYTFVRWNTANDGTGTDYAEGATYSANEDATLYAQWSAETHSLSFDANDGTGSMDDVDLDTDEETTLPANEFSKDGKSFSGWATSAEGSVEYEDEDDYTMGTEDTTLYAVWAEPTVGDLGPAGGYIFYDDTVGYDFDGDLTIASDEKDLLDGNNDGTVSGDRYLEAAPYGWYTTNTDDPTMAWGGNGTYIAGLSDALGAGEANTVAIVTALSSRSRVATEPEPEPEPEPEYAATACADYSVTVDGEVYDDWFLPSKDESNLIYMNLHVSSLGGFLSTGSSGSASYWTSSVTSRNDLACAKIFDFHYGGATGYYSRDLLKYIRPVRAF
ncbi:MAG: InlB B-repeat-containing protein, partial [Spirochaetia bacterium]|nr:InlB B-repeat-containing protein [Spirochaetia bacterium]